MDEELLGELGKMDREALDFISSLSDDKWIFEADILVDMAHVLMLMERDIVPQEEGGEILNALKKIRFQDLSGEDVHVAIENRVGELVGEETAGWMHTARSRNDEVAACIRIRLRHELLGVARQLTSFMEALLDIAGENMETLMPGFTHLQHAEPTTAGHHYLAYYEAFARDLERILSCFNRVNRSPLGSGALTSTTFDIDRELTAELLGFNGILENSMDGVSSRDFGLEAVSCFNHIMLDLSRLAEELIIWSSKEYSFVEIPDRYTSTSSIMPQKKNPDTLELVRAKSGSVMGDYTAISSILKSLPYAYNRDLQELTPKIWSSVEDVRGSLDIAVEVVRGLEFNEDKLRSSSRKGLTSGSEIANYLVREKGMPFRIAHSKVGSLVNEGLDIEEMAVRLGIPSDVMDEITDPEKILSRKEVKGSPSPKKVEKQVVEGRKRLHELEREIDEREKQVEKGVNKLEKKLKEYL
ncbi:argininosuccinate lyase [Methanonatronarchaeum sp. AMET6-2]|uniref:argininosuccinate lyase n=1 Tax=Methanonatronarchaeum sp. AMET6-2 TaxID=2933293 RepID=UPI0011FD59AC|nr:argininosuccinate lyase [Methanonatronarchaeum sp. AMET6-2]RZN62254.1 MAG: argininosuccinate lyase [Methanonatronarchaeia archaeon]UOY10410.1 argininosuccinate lyase [Methanonatronarchaeum sp. AMET6-2]